MEINNYNIINKVIDRNKPFYYPNRNSIICRFKQRYNYYLEASRYNSTSCNYEYYLLVGKTKFNENALKINNDSYGRAIMRLHKDFHNYVKQECIERGNINIDYLESLELYDIYRVE